MPAKVKRVEPLGQIAQRPGDIGSQGRSTVDAYRNNRHGTHARTPRATARALKHGGQRNSATTAKKKQVADKTARERKRASDASAREKARVKQYKAAKKVEREKAAAICT